MSQETAVLIQQAKPLIKAKEYAKARRLLQQAVQQDPQDYRGWLWLASVTSSPQTALEYILRAEMLAPDNPNVAKAKQWAQKRMGNTPTISPKQPATQPTPQPSPPAPQPSRNGWRVGLATTAVLLLFFVGLTAVVWYGNSAAQTTNVAGGGQNEAVQLAAVQATTLPTITPHPTAATVTDAGPVAQASAEPPTPAAQPLQGKQIAPDAPQRATWTPTPLPTSTPIPSPTPLPTFVSETNQVQGKRPLGVGANERWIDVNLTSQTLTAYEGDEPVFSTLVSSGTWQFPTVVGQFRVWLRYESQTMDGRLLGYDYYLENVPYVMYFFEDYAIHGAYWHNNFGNPMSHGCVNVHPTDAQFLFEFSSLGTLVNVHY